jgi:UPF0716 protein FxsA
MRFFVALILLAFPVTEILLLIELADQYGWLLLLYLVAAGWLGLRLIREEKATFNVRMMQNIASGSNPAKAVFGAARNIIAGVLLMLPGVITDIIAVTLLLIPIRNAQPSGESPSNGSSRTSSYQAANDDVIEGEFRRED